jgi:hypothetical protein
VLIEAALFVERALSSPDPVGAVNLLFRIRPDARRRENVWIANTLCFLGVGAGDALGERQLICQLSFAYEDHNLLTLVWIPNSDTVRRADRGEWVLTSETVGRANKEV